MARTVERRTTRTVRRTEGASDIKNNLSNIASEIAKVRDQAREEVNALEKIRGMLDAGYLSDLLRSIEGLEERIEELETVSVEASQDAERLVADLEQEQDRLAKLWDAYKSQEDEMERLKRDYPLMEEKLFERERTIENLRREVDRLVPMAKFKDDVRRLEDENRELTRGLEKSEHENDALARQIETLENEQVKLKEAAANSERVRELEALLEDERERLAKLYKVYEDVEADKKDLEGAVSEWEAWYRRVSPAMESVGQAPTTAPRNN